MDLSALSDSDLKAELDRREKAKAAELERRREERSDGTFKNLDALLELAPNHDRTSCDDNNLINQYVPECGSPRCVRCALLAMKDRGFNSNELCVSIRLSTNPDDLH